MQYRARPMSKNTIKAVAKMIRKRLGLKNNEPFPVINFLDIQLSGLKEGQYTYDVVDDNDMKLNFAETNIVDKTMRIRQSVFDKAVINDPWALKILKHELGHYFLHFDVEVVLPKNNKEIKIRKEEDPEWQADTFADYI